MRKPAPISKEPSQSRIPFSFVFDYLHPLEPEIKRMFVTFALYVEDKIVLILRQKKEHTADNGVWIATEIEHHASLKKQLPSIRSIRLLGKGPTNWQIIPESSDDFEESVIRACELVVKGDPRIGRIPKPKKKRSKSSRK
ncbi:MAG TPA: hypothetical protein VKS81_04305 [Bacteroidota bacterium]|nr:hypothetical protein [Bacteroidota bacterium]